VEGGPAPTSSALDGTSAAESYRVIPVGGRARAALDSEILDLGDVERLDVLPAAGADQMHVADMSGTDADHVDFLLTLARGLTTRDGSPDSVRIDGTNGSDALSVTAAGPFVRTSGLAAIMTVGFGDKTQDRLHLDTKLGNDVISVDPLVHQPMVFTSS
jgi:hypothetical protein